MPIKLIINITDREIQITLQCTASTWLILSLTYECISKYVRPTTATITKLTTKFIIINLGERQRCERARQQPFVWVVCTARQ